MTFVETFVSPDGRIGRAGFALALFVHLVILKGLGITDWMLDLALGHGRYGVAPSAWFFTLAEMWMINVLFVRRWHDLGWSGKTSFLVLVPIAGLIALTPALIVLFFMPGKPDLNRYGPPESLRDSISHVVKPLLSVGRTVLALLGIALYSIGWLARNIGFVGSAITSRGIATPPSPALEARVRSIAVPPRPADRPQPSPARPRAASTMSAPSPVVVRRSRRGLFG
jgi:uncharacterized membrane protein YhaH (DUF805 family)